MDALFFVPKPLILFWSSKTPSNFNAFSEICILYFEDGEGEGEGEEEEAEEEMDTEELRGEATGLSWDMVEDELEVLEEVEGGVRAEGSEEFEEVEEVEEDEAVAPSATSDIFLCYIFYFFFMLYRE